ncbi:hypothetical protein T01_5604 [Trichinella spiralis]|uniref:PiggyBac transposable element-derived protein domain-containing protein n=1 Tax=Trichinella spiralis TaxID=6334 RepID=A0A0V1BT49_TRISP|nr:hypothetical protein T01_5604 [Trichinella spiralis]
MRTGGFALKKWVSNDLEALTDLPPEDVSSADEGRLWKTLGLHWNRHSHHLTFVPVVYSRKVDCDDELTFIFYHKRKSYQSTMCPNNTLARNPPKRHDSKRQLLSLASRLFDPLGCLAPFTIRAKRLFQLLWLKGLDWDDQLPLDINSVWCQWKRELETLESVRVPWALMVTPRDQIRHYGLHIFDDASEAVYGAVAYVMMESLNGAKEVRFCLAKTRVVPVKRLSLPRLDDSSIVLSWVQGDPRRWKPFVSNRVQEILSLTEPSQWRHCPTAGNPADKLSRGCALDTLRGDQLWWNGPAWLKKPAEQWPRLTIALSPEETRLASPERKKVITLCASLQEPSCWTVIPASAKGVHLSVHVYGHLSAALGNASWPPSADSSPDVDATLTSTYLGVKPVKLKPRWNRKQRKRVMVEVPSIVHNYNMHMGGVDLNNMLSGLYRISHKSRNWTKVVFFGVIATAATNGWLFYRREYEVFSGQKSDSID